jgi:hypothetical protein
VVKVFLVIYASTVIKARNNVQLNYSLALAPPLAPVLILLDTESWKTVNSSLAPPLALGIAYATVKEMTECRP